MTGSGSKIGMGSVVGSPSWYEGHSRLVGRDSSQVRIFFLLARHTRMTEGKNETRLASTTNEGIGPMDGSGISVANFLSWFGRF